MNWQPRSSLPVRGCWDSLKVDRHFLSVDEHVDARNDVQATAIVTFCRRTSKWILGRVTWQPRSSLPVRGGASGFWEGCPGNLDRHFVKSERQKRIVIILSFHEDVNGVDLQLTARRGQANKELRMGRSRRKFESWLERCRLFYQRVHI